MTRSGDIIKGDTKHFVHVQPCCSRYANANKLGLLRTLTLENTEDLTERRPEKGHGIPGSGEKQTAKGTGPSMNGESTH